MKLHTDADEMFYFKILDNYRKIEYLLTDLGIKQIKDITGKEIKVEKGQVFTTEMSIRQLEIRKEAVVDAIKNAPNNSCACNCLKDYSKQEDNIRLEYLEKLREQKQIEISDNQTKKFIIRLHNTFFHSLTVCTAEGGLAECYAPTGIHSEKPLENGLKVNAKFISIYEFHKKNQKQPLNYLTIKDVIGKQLENVEVIYTDQGLFFYEIYSRGHSFDTSEIWATFMKCLLESKYVPAIILANGFPNSRCFKYLNDQIQSEFYPTILNFKDDFFSKEGISSYYDSRPEKINIGDLVITEDKIKTLNLPKSSIISPITDDSLFMKNSSTLLISDINKMDENLNDNNTNENNKNNNEKQNEKQKERQKDFCGMIISDTISEAQINDYLKEYKSTLQAWAKFLSQVINVFLSTGEFQIEILQNGFDLKVFNSRVRKANKKKKKKSQQQKEITENEKNKMIHELILSFKKIIMPFYQLNENQLQEMYTNNLLHFYELRIHIEAVIRKSNYLNENNNFILNEINFSHLNKNLKFMRYLLKNHSTLNSIGRLPVDQQEHLIRWSFWNEDKVWRYRGGRTETTVNDFLHFVNPDEFSAYPGIFIRNENCNDGNITSLADCERSITAYLVGEFVNANTYEIVTAWTDPHYTKLNFAVSVSKFLIFTKFLILIIFRCIFVQ